MNTEKTKQLARMCTVQIHKNGDVLNLAEGGILLRGGLNFKRDDRQRMASSKNMN